MHHTVPTYLQKMSRYDNTVCDLSRINVEQFLFVCPGFDDVSVFVLQEVRDQYTAVVKLIDSGDKLKLDQNHVETVIPAPGKPNRTTPLSGRLRLKSAEHVNADVGCPCR